MVNKMKKNDKLGLKILIFGIVLLMIALIINYNININDSWKVVFIMTSLIIEIIGLIKIIKDTAK